MGFSPDMEKIHKKFTKILCKQSPEAPCAAAENLLYWFTEFWREEGINMVNEVRKIADDVDDLIYTDTELVHSER